MSADPETRPIDVMEEPSKIGDLASQPISIDIRYLPSIMFRQLSPSEIASEPAIRGGRQQALSVITGRFM